MTRDPARASGRLVAVALFLLAAAADAELYRWSDAEGRVHYGDRPPSGAAADAVGAETGGGFSVLDTIPSAREEAPARPSRPRRVRDAGWRADAAGLAEARRQQKREDGPLIVYFRTDWCPHCRRLDDLLEEPEVRAALASIPRVRINPEHGEAERALFESYGGKGYPAFYVHRGPDAAPSRVSHSGPASRFLASLRRHAGLEDSAASP